MKFDFSDISFADVIGYSMLKEGSDAERTEPVSKGISWDDPAHMNRNGAEKYVDTFLNPSIGKSRERDSITDFYSDLASPSTKEEKNISNQQNTADRHGRT
ncbi:MAG: hypothetical protein CL666_02605 [Balneola sp.]|nr:hypothetical protein [Balneola sp.]